MHIYSFLNFNKISWIFKKRKLVNININNNKLVGNFNVPILCTHKIYVVLINNIGTLFGLRCQSELSFNNNA